MSSEFISPWIRSDLMYYIDSWTCAIIEMKTNTMWRETLSEIRDRNYDKAITLLDEQQRTNIRKVWTR